MQALSQRLDAKRPFSADAKLALTNDDIPTKTDLEPIVGERRVDEWLGELPGNEVGQVRLEERSGSQAFPERHCVGRQSLNRLLYLGFAVVDDGQDTVEPVKRRLERLAVFSDEPLDLLGERRDIARDLFQSGVLDAHLG